MIPTLSLSLSASDLTEEAQAQGVRIMTTYSIATVITVERAISDPAENPAPLLPPTNNAGPQSQLSYTAHCARTHYIRGSPPFTKFAFGARLVDLLYLTQSSHLQDPMLDVGKVAFTLCSRTKSKPGVCGD